MGSLIDGATAAVSAHPGLAVALGFLAAVVEAVAVLGAIVPGTPILMAVAAGTAMAGQPVWPIMAVAVAGAVIGDGISFCLGWRFSARLRAGWPFARRPELLCRADAFFARFGVLSVALCRFVPVLRSTVPLVAGMARMGRRRFAMANVASAFVWAPAHVLPARYAGVSLSAWERGDAMQAAYVAAGVLVCGFAAWYVHRRSRQI